MNCGTATVTVKPSKYKLTVKKTGDGAGTVTSNPKGINCGSDCSQVYDMNVTVILSAKPAAGSNFIKWSGDCSGMGNCTLDMNRARKVTVEFSTTCPSGYRDCGKFCCLSNQYCCSTGPACCPASKFLYCDKSNKCFAQITDPENTCGFWDYEVCEPPY